MVDNKAVIVHDARKGKLPHKKTVAEFYGTPPGKRPRDPFADPVPAPKAPSLARATDDPAAALRVAMGAVKMLAERIDTFATMHASEVEAIRERLSRLEKAKGDKS